MLADAPGMHLFNGTKTLNSLFDLPCSTAEMFFDKKDKSRSELIQAVVDGLIREQRGKQLSPMIQDVIMGAALGGETLEVPVQMHSQ